MIAVTFALPEESKDFQRELTERKRVASRKAGPVLTGRTRGKAVVIWHTGVGLEAASRETLALIENHRPSLLVSSGFAGGISETLRVGDVVFDARGAMYGGFEQVTPRCFAGKIQTEREALETPEEKRALERRTGAVAVDMETAGIEVVCAKAGIPFVGIRGISDAVTDRLPVPMAHWFDMNRQRARPLSLVFYLIRNPGRIAPFARFVSGLSGARAAMTRCILRFLEATER